MFFRFFKVQVFQGPGPSFKSSPQLFYFFYKELHDKMSKLILSSSDGWHWLSQHRSWQIADVCTDVLETANFANRRTWFFWDVSSRTNHFSFLSAYSDLKKLSAHILNNLCVIFVICFSFHVKFSILYFGILLWLLKIIYIGVIYGFCLDPRRRN